jgi:hypothetical protein
MGFTELEVSTVLVTVAVFPVAVLLCLTRSRFLVRVTGGPLEEP